MRYGNRYDSEWQLELLVSKPNVLIFEYDILRDHFVWAITGNILLFRYQFVGQTLILRKTSNFNKVCAILIYGQQILEANSTLL